MDVLLPEFVGMVRCVMRILVGIAAYIETQGLSTLAPKNNLSNYSRIISAPKG